VEIETDALPPQFVSRSGSTPKFWVFKARSPRMNVGFFNR
jgi:hypothetical protein